MSTQQKNKRLAGWLLGLVVLMGALAFAAVPAYNWFCRVTGFGGETNTAVQESAKVLDRTITVRFDASLERGMPWEFKPAQREMQLKIGETGLAFFEAHNPTNRTVAGTASYNVSPYSTGYYFTKIECFCFSMQVLGPGETAMMPVSFYVDPEIVDDEEAKYVNTITLSYTFHKTELPKEQASLSKVPVNPLN